MAADPRDTAALLLSGKAPGGEGPAVPDTSEELDELAIAGDEVMSAMQAGDTQRFTEALRGFVEICGAKSSYEE